MDLLTIFYSEVLCAWFYVSLLSNNLVAVEAKIQTLLLTMLQQAPTQGQGQGQGQSLATGSNSNYKLSNSNSGGGGGYGRGGIGASSSLLASSHNTVGGIKTLQQQQKQQQYKNYQSISMDESLP